MSHRRVLAAAALLFAGPLAAPSPAQTSCQGLPSPVPEQRFLAKPCIECKQRAQLKADLWSQLTIKLLPRPAQVGLQETKRAHAMDLVAAGEITVVASFLGGIAALRSSVPHPSLGDPAVLRAVLMTGAYLALTGLAGLGIGAILRHGAAAVGVLAGGLFVLPLITGAASRATGKFMPELIAGNSLAAVKPVAGFTWSPWLELGIVALQVAALLAAGGWLLVRRDA